MSGFVLSPNAEDDIFEIWLYLVREASVEIANRIESEVYDTLDLLARNPGIGHKRPDLTDYPVLFHRVFPYQYLVIYRNRAPLEIAGVLHAKRNIKKILSERSQ